MKLRASRGHNELEDNMKIKVSCPNVLTALKAEWEDNLTASRSKKVHTVSTPTVLTPLKADWENIMTATRSEKVHSDRKSKNIAQISTGSEDSVNQCLNKIKKNPLDTINQVTYNCDKCDFSSESKKSYKNHCKRNVHSAKIYRCIYPFCKYQSMAKKTFLRHIDNIHEPSGEELHCELCNYKVSRTNKSNYHRHIRAVHLKLKELTCPECDYSTSNRWDIDKHLKSIHYKVKDFSCPSCPYKSSYKYILERHEKAVHSRVKDFLCPYDECDFTATLNKYLSRHIKNVHETQLKKFACIECDFRSIEKGMLERHVATIHRKVKDFKCQECEHQTSCKYSLEKHIKVTHEGIREYKCTDCSYETSEKSALNNHIRSIHLKINDFECNYCPRKFAIKNSLQTHVRLVHLKIKPIICSYDGCTYKTLKKSRLEDHISTCHIPKLIACPECSYEIDDKALASFHFENYHPGLQIHFCSKCMFGTKHEKSLHKHMKLCHSRSKKSVPFLKNCNKCDFHTYQRKLLLQHQKLRHPLIKKENKKYYCPHSPCTSSFDQNNRLINHIKIEHWKKLGKQEIRCLYCDFKAGFHFVMRDHCTKIHNIGYVKQEFKSERESWKTETLQQFEVKIY